MKRRTKRIYYGPPGAEKKFWWSVKVRDAKKNVEINGSIRHALKSHAGVDVGCTFSNMSVDKSNAKLFPHPVYLASFTRSTALLVDSLKKNGEPNTAVLYEHSYAGLVDYNDSSSIKQMATDHPELVERPFLLRVPRRQVRRGGKNSGSKGLAGGRVREPNDALLSYMPRGALRRAVKAGLIGKHVADQITSITTG